MAVKAQLDRLAAFEPAPYPVVSLYLNTQPGQTGRDQFHTFVRKEFAADGFPVSSTTRSSRRPTALPCSRAQPASCSKLCR